jgi:hypothetical protein
MKSRSRTVSIFFSLVVLTGCAATKVTQQTPMVSPELARPDRIWVYDFIADPAKIPADSSLSAALSAPSTPPTAASTVDPSADTPPLRSLPNSSPCPSQKS